MICVFTLTNKITTASIGRRKNTHAQRSNKNTDSFSVGMKYQAGDRKSVEKEKSNIQETQNQRLNLGFTFLLCHTQSFCHTLSPPSDYEILPILSVDVSRRLPLPPGSIGSSKITS